MNGSLGLFEATLGGILVAIFSSILGSWFTSRRGVNEDLCGERRISCSKHNESEFKHIRSKLESIEKSVLALLHQDR